MLMASAQRWVDNQCCRCVLCVLTIRHQLAATALILPSDTWEYVKVLNIADLFCLHGNIRPGNTTFSLFFGALKLFFDPFVFLAKISRLYSFI